MVVNVDVVGGSGTIASWNISVAGIQGATGPTGPTGSTGSSFYDVALFYSGKPTANEVILRHVVARAFSLTATASSHKLLVGTNPGANADIKFSKVSGGTTTILMYIRVATNGTITYRDASNAAALTTLATTAFAVGDQLLITAPASADSTMADIYVTLVGTVT
jgi:hypothetical protein